MQLGPMFKLLALRVVPGHLDRAIRPGSDGQRVLSDVFGLQLNVTLHWGAKMVVFAAKKRPPLKLEALFLWFLRGFHRLTPIL